MPVCPYSLALGMYFSAQGLQPADAILIGSDLQFMRVLTKLDLKYNDRGDRGDAGNKELRDAVSGEGPEWI